MRKALMGMVGLAGVLLLAACGGSSPTATVAPTPTNTPVELDLAPTATPSTAADPTASASPATPTPTPTATPVPFERSTGQVDNVAFVVGEGSEATFTVEEQLVSLPLPNDAVMRTTRLSGTVRLDGATSAVQIDLHSMTSDQTFRDRYVQRTMFPNDRSATITFGDLTPLPEGFTAGDQVSAQVTGTLSIKGVDADLTFEVTARDDGDVVFVLGRSTFTWQQLSMPVPSARSVVSVEDEVRVEVLLALEPQRAP